MTTRKCRCGKPRPARRRRCDACDKKRYGFNTTRKSSIERYFLPVQRFITRTPSVRYEIEDAAAGKAAKELAAAIAAAQREEKAIAKVAAARERMTTLADELRADREAAAARQAAVLGHAAPERMTPGERRQQAHDDAA